MDGEFRTRKDGDEGEWRDALVLFMVDSMLRTAVDVPCVQDICFMDPFQLVEAWSRLARILEARFIHPMPFQGIKAGRSTIHGAA